ncbi:MAG: peptide ABC transporter permease [Dehalococcoidia bacterium]|nr:MAG: peptide ABC transporter permease [Dehalococcoidia bacterium]
MTRYWLGRLVQAVVLVVGVSIVVFVVVRLAPGDPATLLADPSFLSEQQRRELRASLGLEEPWPVQYVKTMAGLLRGDLRSFRTRESTASMIANAVPVTFSVVFAGVVLALASSIPLGVAAAQQPGGWADRLLSVAIAVALAFPTFVLALFLIRLLAEEWRLLPAGGFGPPGTTGFNPLVILPHLVLPALVTAFPLGAILGRYVRDAVREVLAEDYVRTAHSKGLSPRVVQWRHVFPNALVAVISVVGTVTPLLLGGAVIVESLFGLPGLGRIAVQGALQRDYPVVIATTLFSAVLVVLGNLLTDLLYGVVDPRIRLH